MDGRGEKKGNKIDQIMQCAYKNVTINPTLMYNNNNKAPIKRKKENNGTGSDKCVVR